MDAAASGDFVRRDGGEGLVENYRVIDLDVSDLLQITYLFKADPIVKMRVDTSLKPSSDGKTARVAFYNEKGEYIAFHLEEEK